MKLDITYADHPKKYWISTAAHITRTDGPAPVGAAITLILFTLGISWAVAIFLPAFLGWVRS